MVGAFEQAWTLLKQRGHAPLRQESEDPQDYLSDDELAHEGLPVEAKDIPLEYDPRIVEQQGRAAEEIEAEGIDLPDGPRVSAVPPASVGRAGSIMGEGRPNLKELYFGSNNQTPAARNQFITADDFMKPPVLIAPQRQAVRVNNPFDPNEVALMRQTLANEQTPMGQALARIRAGSGPRPLQFDQ